MNTYNALEKILLGESDANVKISNLSRLVAQVRNQYTRLQIQYNDLKQEAQKKEDQLMKQINLEKKKRQDIQDEKFNIRSQLMDQIEERDERICKLKKELVKAKR